MATPNLTATCMACTEMNQPLCFLLPGCWEQSLQESHQGESDVSIAFFPGLPVNRYFRQVHEKLMAVGETGRSLKCCAWTCGAGGHRHRGMLLIFCALWVDAKSMLFWTLIPLAVQGHWHASSIIMIHFTLPSFHSFYCSRDFPEVLKLCMKFKDRHISTQFLLYPSLTSKGSSFHSAKMLHIINVNSGLSSDSVW